MLLNIIVAYANTEKQLEIPLQITRSTTVAMAIKRSGILEYFPEIELSTAVVGIYGKKIPLDALLCDQDRVEIYRPLVRDPKERRRSLAGPKK